MKYHLQFYSNLTDLSVPDSKSNKRIRNSEELVMIIISLVGLFWIKKCFGIDGVIWNKVEQNFMPISSIQQFPTFEHNDRIVNGFNLNKNQSLNGTEIRLIYFDVSFDNTRNS